MSRIMRIDVLPDAAGHWSVTHDRVVDAEFDNRDSALRYAGTCVERARRNGREVRLEVYQPIEEAAQGA